MILKGRNPFLCFVVVKSDSSLLLLPLKEVVKRENRSTVLVFALEDFPPKKYNKKTNSQICVPLPTQTTPKVFFTPVS